MPSLRDYRDRIKSVKSTKKITSAMKMVAASKLRRAQEQAEASQPYAEAMASMLARVAKNVTIGPNSSKLLAGTGSDQRYVIILVTADRGLCGGFNGNLYRNAYLYMQELLAQGKDVSIICAGTKGRDLARRNMTDHFETSFDGITSKTPIEYVDSQKLSDYVLAKFEEGGFDVCTLIYNEFRSVLIQKPVRQQLIPFSLPEAEAVNDNENDADQENTAKSPYDFEPEEEEILNALLPKNIAVQVFRALLDSAAGEQAARMTAMDAATRNASEMIDDLTLQYNRARQAYITKELIEIISGAEAL